MGILEKLKISYDGLKPVEKELFLDIACFFRRKSKDETMKILDACGFQPHIGVKVLIQKALITVSEEGWFDMHDLVQEMGHYIVRGEHPYNPEKHSRVWRKDDIEDICSRNATMENDKIEGIQCDAFGRSFNFIMFVSNMKKLRFLKVTTISFGERPNFVLSNELRYIDWNGYPASPFPKSFQPKKLVVLKMQRSWQLEELWKGYKYLPCLKEMELYCMYALGRTPDFGGLPCLRKLILHECGSLEEIHESLGNHAILVSVEVRSCYKLTRFPSIVGMEKLETLKISFCELIEFPKIEASMDKLVTLSLKGVDIEILPSTIVEYCTNLTMLSLEDCSKLKSIEGNFHCLKGLQNIKLKGCKQFEKLPKDIFNENLDGLGLRKLNLSWCELKDGDIPSEICELSTLQELHLLGNDFTRLDFSLSRLTRLKLLNLNWCQNLVELPELPSSLAILKAHMCRSLEVIKDEAHRRCKWLCEVSIQSGRKNITGGTRLLESMLQGKTLKSGCMIFQLNGSEIPRGFESRMVRGWRSKMQLPEHWYNHFSGFLFCATSCGDIDPFISMKHVEKSSGDSWMGIGDSQDDDVNRTCVMYFPFSLLRHTSWWNPKSTAVEMEFGDSMYSKIRRCGLKLVPKGAAEFSSEKTPTHSSSKSNDDDDYKCKLRIRDSKSVFNFRFI